MIGEDDRLSFFEYYQMNVVIIPVRIDEAKFLKFANIIKEHCVIDLCDASRSQTRWKSGRVRYSYFLHKMNSSEWDELYSSMRVTAVIGIGDCREVGEISELSAEFGVLAEAYPSAVCKMVLAIDPPLEHFDGSIASMIFAQTAHKAELTEMIIKSHLLCEITKNVLTAFEREAYSTADTVGAYISTPVDSVKTCDDVSELKLRKGYRLAKRRGDLCLQAGQPDAAAVFYARALESARAHSDTLWAGAALEGICAGIILKNEKSVSTCEEEVMKKYADVLHYYGRKPIPWVEFECHVRIAYFQFLVGHKARASEWLARASAFCEAAGATAAADRDKAAMYSRISEVYRMMGFRRKYALYLWLASEIYDQKLKNIPAASNLVEHSAEELGLRRLLRRERALSVENNNNTYIYTSNNNGNNNGTNNNNNNNGNNGNNNSNNNNNDSNDNMKDDTMFRGKVVPFEERGWTTIQIPVLAAMMGIARTMRSPTKMAIYGFYLLRNYHALLDPASQEDLALELIKASEMADRPLDISGVALPIPIVSRVVPVELTGKYIPVPPPKADADSPFLYTPASLRAAIARKNAKGAVPEVVWVDGEECTVKVKFRNPLAIDIKITKICFRTAGAVLKYDGLPLCVPRESSLWAFLACKVHGAGKLLIQGVFTEVFGILSYAPIQESGAAYTDVEFYKGSADFLTGGGSNGSGRAVTVIDRMPLLDVIDHSDQLGTDHYLYEHELYRQRFEIKNVGTKPIGHFELTLKSEEDRCRIADWDPERSLPILPNTSVPLHVVVNPRFSNDGVKKPVELTIKYGETPAGYTRSFSLQFKYNVSPSIRFDKFDVVGSPMSQEHFNLALALSNASPSLLTVSVLAANPESGGSLVSSLKSSYSSSPVPSDDNETNNNSIIKNDEDSNNSIIKNDDNNSIICDDDPTPPPWRIISPVNNQLCIPPAEVATVILDFRRLVPPAEYEDLLYSYLSTPGLNARSSAEEQQQQQQLAEQKPRKSMAPSKYRKAELTAEEKLYVWIKERVFKNLSVAWRATESAHGQVFLNDPKLTLRMARQICIPPVVMAIACDGKRVSGVEYSVPFPVETLHVIEVSIRNRRTAKRIDGPLMVGLKVTNQHGKVLPPERLITVGPLQTTFVDGIGPGSEVKHTINVIIMQSGSFVFTATLGNKDQFIASVSARAVFEDLMQ